MTRGNPVSGCVRGIHRSPVNSRHKGQWRGALMFSLICAWMNGYANNREAGDLRRHHAHYGVIVMVNGFRGMLATNTELSASCKGDIQWTCIWFMEKYLYPYKTVWCDLGSLGCKRWANGYHGMWATILICQRPKWVSWLKKCTTSPALQKLSHCAYFILFCWFFLCQGHGLTLITAWMSNRMPSTVLYEIIVRFLNLNGYTVEV